ncbi:unnamed protein product [Clonostachys rosea]|uniref:F-box domain-containing protein n=1 Tax=Bionectria ochroleuca TaxID=29856 RepID=A0ABY6TUA9_BIOOC|nr:unnamed protein product [Clonostachys rosea]
MLSTLPTEILHRIFKLFETPFRSWEQGDETSSEQCPRPHDLIALSKVCHRFHAVARPLIYRTLVFRSDVDLDLDDSFLDRFLHVICADPSIGLNIRRLHAGTPLSDFDVDHFADKLLAAPETTLDERRKRWLERWSKVGKHNVAQVLLLLAPQVRVLDYFQELSEDCVSTYLSGRQDVEDELFATVGLFNNEDTDSDAAGSETASQDGDEDNQSDGAPAGQLQNRQLGLASENPMGLLREVRLKYGSYMLLRMRHAEDILLNPGIKILRLEGFRWTKGDVRVMKWNDVVSNVTTLQLRNCLIDARGLSNALCRCRLRHLHIVLPTHSRLKSDREGEGVDFDEMGAVLRRHGQSLESLDFESIAFRKQCRVNGYLGPLNVLSGLTSLKMSVEELGQFNEEDEDELKSGLRTFLPPALESIHIRPSKDTGRRVPRTLLVDEAFSTLQTVEVEVDDANDNEINLHNLKVSGWSKSSRSDMVCRDNEGEEEPDGLSPCTVAIFLRDVKVYQMAMGQIE